MTIYEIVQVVLDVMEREKIDYLLVGAVATGAWAVPRSTTDADFVVAAPAEDVNRFIGKLPANFAIDPQSRLEPFTGTMRWVVRIEGTEFKVEIFMQGQDPHHLEERRRRKLVRLTTLGREAWIPTPEDIVIQKLRWGRTKDIQDVDDILTVQGDALDFGYIQGWTDTHGTSARLAEIRASIPPDI